MCGRLELSKTEIIQIGLSADYTIAPASIRVEESMHKASFFCNKGKRNYKGYGLEEIISGHNWNASFIFRSNKY